jgi:hypothetical protein
MLRSDASAETLRFSRDPIRRANGVARNGHVFFASAQSPRRSIVRPLDVDIVEEPPVVGPALGICGAVGEADSWLFASCGEDRCRGRDELRQFPQVLGGGGQQELIFGSTRPTQAQSIQPEDALQMSEEHLDLLSFAT